MGNLVLEITLGLWSALLLLFATALNYAHRERARQASHAAKRSEHQITLFDSLDEERRDGR